MPDAQRVRYLPKVLSRPVHLYDGRLYVTRGCGGVDVGMSATTPENTTEDFRRRRCPARRARYLISPAPGQADCRSLASATGECAMAESTEPVVMLAVRIAEAGR